jgi:hypothetical protein
VPAITIFDSQEEIPENVRDKATEVEGKFHVAADALMANYNQTLAEKKARDTQLKDLRAQVEKFKDLDPDKAREALGKIQEAEDKALRAKGDWDSREKALRTGFDTEKQAWTTKETGYETTLDELVVFNELSRAGSLPEVKLRDAELIYPHIKRFVKREGKDYKVLDESGEARYGSDGKPLRLEAFLTELRAHPKMGIFFEPTGAAGSGADPNARGGVTTGKTIKRDDFNKLSPQDRMTLVKEKKTAIVD